MPQSKILRSVEQAMERALRPGAFITDQACFSFVRQLDRVAAQLATLLAVIPGQGDKDREGSD
jgi:hypothetical protein